MVFRIHTCTNWGIETHPVLCEVDLSCQLPSFSLVGLPSSITQESKERVRAAIVNSGLDWPEYKITINLLPASLPKWGSHFELSMALGILGAGFVQKPKSPTTSTGSLSTGSLITRSFFALGELSLTGEVRPARWVAAARALLCTLSEKEALCVMAHPDDVALLKALEVENLGIELVAVTTLQEASELFFKRLQSVSCVAEKTVRSPSKLAGPSTMFDPLSTLKQVQGEPLGVIAALLASRQRLHTLFVGPQGCGKSMLVRAICQAQPKLSPAEAAQRECLFSLFSGSFLHTAGAAKPVVYLQTSATRASLEGALLSNGQLLAGELTRAHLGLLVADEMLEFRRDTLECLRQPIEENIVRLQRAKFHTVLPSQFQLLASANLCPCGEWGRHRGECRCHRPRVKEYQKKLSGPLLDRFDLVLFIGEDRKALFFESLAAETKALAAEILRQPLWEQRLAHKPTLESPLEPQTQLQAFSKAALSHRGVAKVLYVKKALETFVGPNAMPKFSNYAYEELALALRQDLQPILKDGKRRGLLAAI